MRRARYIPVLLGAAVVAAVGAHSALSSHTAVSSTMHAFVHEDASIGLTFDDGSDIGNQARTPPTIPAGTYTLRVTDDALTHNFHLGGPGVDVGTTIGGTGTPSFTITLQPGANYRFQCDDHPDFMYGEFNTAGAGSGGTTSGGSSSGGSSSGGSTTGGSTGGATGSGSGTSSNTGGSSGSTALRGTFIGRVNPAGKLALTYGGIPVVKVKAGRYRFTVADKTPARSFVVQAKGRAATTVSGVAFVGTHSVTVNLTPGQWSFYSSAGSKSAASFTVTS
jgi:hypothetical protein